MKRIVFVTAAAILCTVFFTSCKQPQPAPQNSSQTPAPQSNNSTSPAAKITITVKGDENIQLMIPSGQSSLSFEVKKGTQWNEIEPLAKNKIKITQHYELKNWHIIDKHGAVLDNHYTTPFNENTTVFAETKLKNIKLTIQEHSHITITGEKTLIKPYGTKWGEIKAEIQAKITPHTNFKVIAWRLRNKNGIELQDSYEFKAKTTALYVETRPVQVTITVKGDEHIQLHGTTTITSSYGTKWSAIKDEAKSKIACKPGYAFAAWKKDSIEGFELIDNYEFEEENTDVFAVTQAVPVSAGVKVTPPTEGIAGHESSCALPSGADGSWKGVFTNGRTVKLKPYMIGTHEVTVKIWNEVYEWAKAHGYEFNFDSENEDTPTEFEHPIANISWCDCIVWCNAYTEMKFGTKDECAYRKESESGAVITSTDDSDTAFCDFSKKGYRLPVEAEWEYAARYQEHDSTNAEKYGNVYLTNLNSASGAAKPIGFEGMTMPAGESYETLCAETARVTVFNKYYNGSDFVQQPTPAANRAAVGSKDANKLGIFDMSGNVAEWCWDLYKNTITASSEVYPTGPFNDTTHVVRGGYWSVSDIENTKKAVYTCMAGKREYKGSSKADPIRGFRLVWKD